MAHICEKALMPVVTGEFDFKNRKVQALLKDSFEVFCFYSISIRQSDYGLERN